MPRKNKTQGGDNAQKIKSVPGQRYGEGVQQQALQRQMPAPDLVSQTSQALSAASAPAAPQEEQPVVTPAQNYAAQLAAARQVTGAGLLAAPTTRPDEPVTAGLTLGPGPGRDVLRPMTGTPTGDFYAMVSRVTGNPQYEQLGKRAGF